MSLAFCDCKRISLQNRLLMADAFNLDNNKGIVNFVIRVIKESLMIEGLGAIAYSIFHTTLWFLQEVGIQFFIQCLPL